MQHISKAEEWAIGFYPENKENCNYKLSDYLICHKYKDGYIVFQTITWSFFFLTDNEFENMTSNDLLIRSKVVIDSDINEEEIAEKAYKERSMIKNIKPYKRINSYVILTTNTCNANCLYCFQDDKIGDMTIDTAQKIIELIKNKHTKEVFISWFGGEPLKNTSVIDYISDKLTKENIKFMSHMITNGSLLTKDLLEKAENKWNLKKAQITIDGPEKYYNYVKNYDNFNGSPFKAVFQNMKDILNHSGIEISIRLNASQENIDLLEELVKYINSELSDVKSRKFSYYFRMLYQISNNSELLKKDDFENKFYGLIKNYGNLNNELLLKKHNLIHCMADRCQSIAITPNGNIYNCEHCVSGTEIGTLDGGIYNTEYIKSTINKLGNNLTKCKNFNCKLIPICEKCNFCQPQIRCTNEPQFVYQNEFFLKMLEYTTDYYS